MTAPVFVDTNVFVYRFDRTEPAKQERCQAWLEELWRAGNGRVSYQVLQELYVTVTRKLDPGLPPAEARAVVRALEAWQPATVGPRTLETAWDLQDRWSLSWWDALIVAAALAAGCETLLTEDLQAGAEIDGVHIVDPFATAPEDLEK